MIIEDQGLGIWTRTLEMRHDKGSRVALINLHFSPYTLENLTQIVCATSLSPTCWAKTDFLEIKVRKTSKIMLSNMILFKFFNLLLFARKNHFLSLSTTYLCLWNNHKCLFKINSLYKSKRWKLSHLPVSYYQTGWSKPSDVSSITFFTSSVW